MTGGIAKAYLTSLFGGKVEVKLNDGQCPVNETEVLYYFHTSRNPPVCGIEKKVRELYSAKHKICFIFKPRYTISLDENPY